MRIRDIASRFGLETECVISDGSQPVGHSIGPALEMTDVLSVLRLEEGAPKDLRQRALEIAAAVLELGQAAAADGGLDRARQLLEDGSAYSKFERICLAQGGFREPARAVLNQVITSNLSGRISEIDNRRIARIAKFAGAPDDPAAGLKLHVRVGDEVQRGQPLITVFADSSSEIAYALDYAASVDHGLKIEA
jgi:thymidine phosphorylase